MPTRDLRGVRELGTPGVCKATEAALGGVQAATLLSSAVAGAQDVALLLLLLLGSPLHSSASAGSTSTAAASASATPPATATAASSSTAATEAPTSATTPTPTPSSSLTATTAAPTTSSSSLSPLGLADAASLTKSRRCADRLSANKVDSSSRGNRGQKRNRGAPLKERELSRERSAVASVTSAEVRNEFREDLPVLRLHSDRGGEFSSDLLREFCRGEGIVQSFTLLASPQKNGIAERHIGLVIEVARTSMIHAAAPHFLWPFAVRYAVYQLNLWPRVSLPETSLALRKVGDASMFRDITFNKSVPFYCLFPYDSAPLPPPPLFLARGPPLVDPLPPQGPAPSGLSQVDPLPLAELIKVTVDSGATQGAASGGAASGGAEPASGEHGGAEPKGAEPKGTESEGAETGGAELEGAEPGGTEREGAEPGGAEFEGVESGSAEPRGTASAGGPAGALQRLSLRQEPLQPQQLREWFAQRTRLRSGAAGAGGSAAGGTGAGRARATSLGGAGVPARAGGTGGAGAASPRGARTRGTGDGGGGAGGAGDGDPGAGGAGAVDPGAGGAASGGTGAGGTVQRRPFFVPRPPSSLPPPDSVLRQVLNSPLPTPSPYTEQTDYFIERREPESRPASPVRAARTGHWVPCPRPPPLPGTHVMALRPSSVALQVPLPPPPESSLPAIPDPKSDLARAAIAGLVDFAAVCRLDYVSSLAAESESNCPPSVGGECALGTDVLEDTQEDFECLAAAVPHLMAMLLVPEGDPDALDIPTPRSYAEAITGPYSSQWETAMDAEMASWKSTSTYVDAVPPPGANIVDGMWIFRVKWPPGSPPFFKARYIARGFIQRHGVDFFQTFSPTIKMTTLWVLLHVVAQRDYELHSLDFSTAFLQGSLHEEIWLRCPPGFTGSFPTGTQWSLQRPDHGLRHAPREWHDTVRMTLVALGFAPSIADPSLFLRTDTLLPPFYILVYVDNLVFATADTEALALMKSELQKRHTCTDLGPSALRLPVLLATVHSSTYRILARYVASGRHCQELWEASRRVLRYLCSTSGMGLVLGGRGPIVLTGHVDASWVDDLATQRSSQGYTFSLFFGSVSWRSTHSSSVLSSSCEAKIYAGAMATQELRWLTYLLTDLGEWPRSSPVLYVDNKAMIALCHEHRLEHRTKHIALRYFLARDLQQRGQLCLAYVATRANTADIFTKALQLGDHQHFCTFLGLVPTLTYLLTT
ncbi:unnamed protein product [Closterium sp. NIES-53]